MNQISNSLNVVTIDLALLFSGHCRQNRPDSHRLAVQPGAVAGELFDCVTECVTKIEFGALAFFFFISGNDTCLNLAGSSDHFGHRLGIERS